MNDEPSKTGSNTVSPDDSLPDPRLTEAELNAIARIASESIPKPEVLFADLFKVTGPPPTPEELGVNFPGMARFNRLDDEVIDIPPEEPSWPQSSATC